MTLFAGLERIVRTDAPMSEHTWFRIGGPANYFIEPATVAELQEVVKRCRDSGVPMFVLGGGAKLLVDDAGVKGAVIHMAQGEFRDVTLADGIAKAGAGADMGKLVLRCVREGLSGIECMTGVPGTIGGCVRKF